MYIIKFISLSIKKKKKLNKITKTIKKKSQHLFFVSELFTQYFQCFIWCMLYYLVETSTLLGKLLVFTDMYPCIYWLIL